MGQVRIDPIAVELVERDLKRQLGNDPGLRHLVVLAAQTDQVLERVVARVRAEALDVMHIKAGHAPILVQ